MGTFQTGIQFKKGILNNGAPLPGADYISSLLFYNSTPPALWPVSGYKQLFGLQDAINCGITGNHEDETQATGTYALSAAGAVGDIISIYFQEPVNPNATGTSPNLVLLAAYVKKTADSTATLLGASVAAAITANQANNGGYTATSSTGTITMTVRKGLGVYPNTGNPFSVSITGTIAGTLTQNVQAGVASYFDVYYYHISEFFRMNQNAQLWVGIYTTPSSYTFTEIASLQAASKGVIRQIGVYVPARVHTANFAADVATINAVCQTLDDNKMPLSAVLAEDISPVTDLSTLTNLSGLNSEWVSPCIGQDGAAKGWGLYKSLGKSVTNIGAMMGAISIAQVSECIGNPIPKFNISDGSENETPAFANNTLYSAVAFPLLTQLDNFRYIYIGNYVGYAGTYFSDSHCCILQNSNYGYIEQNRIQSKIERLLYPAYLPFVKGNLPLNADGTLANTIVVSLESIGDGALAIMLTARELSGENVIIDPKQNIQSSGKLVITLYNLNNQIARSIEIDTNSVTALPS